MESGVEFQYIDITDSMRSLKIFLAFRDKSPYFDPIKKKGSVGIPTIMIGHGEKFLDGVPGMDIEELIRV
ncbi:MAG: glutaredoxin [Bacillota bacterium]